MRMHSTGFEGVAGFKRRKARNRRVASLRAWAIGIAMALVFIGSIGLITFPFLGIH